MKVLRNIILLYALLCAVMHTAMATITFASKDAGFIIPENSTINFSGATLNSGTVYNNGGTISSGRMYCSDMTFVTRDESTISTMVTDGDISFGDDLLLADYDRLLVQGGLVEHDVVVEAEHAEPAAIEGYGSFSSNISMIASTGLVLRWMSPLNVDVVADYSQATGEYSFARVTLENDLAFAPGHSFTGGAIIIHGNRHIVSLGGGTTINHQYEWDDAHLCLTGSLTINDATIYLRNSAAFINGNGNELIFANGGQLNNNGRNVTLTNITLVNPVSGSFDDQGDWILNGVTFKNNDSSVTVNGTIDGTGFDFFGPAGGAVGFTGNTELVLNRHSSFSGEWVFDGTTTINGNNNTLDLSNGTLTLEHDVTLNDIVLSDVQNVSIDNYDEYSLFLSNVQWLSSDNGGVLIHSLSVNDSGAECYLNDSNHAQGNIFTNISTHWSNALIELQTNVQLGDGDNAYRTNWYCNNTVIDGDGHVLDLEHGTLSALNNTLTLRNIVLKNVTQDSFADANAVISLSNVTIHLSDDVDLSSWVSSYFTITGPVTFITGAYTFTAPEDSVIDGVTAYYDTLSATDANNVQGFGLINAGRLLFIAAPVTGDILVDALGSVYLGRTEYLAASISGRAGRTLTFSADGITHYNGLGRSLVFPVTDDTVLTVDAGTTVNMSNITLDGLRLDQLDNNGTLHFGDKTIIRLSQDWALAQQLTFGTASNATNEVVIVDFNGFTIDFDDADAKLFLQGGNTLKLCNGRLLNVRAYQIEAASNGSSLILENIEIALTHSMGAFAFGYSVDAEENISAALRFEGRCSITGLADNTFINYSLADTTIAAGATLSVMYNMEYCHSAVSADIVFADASSTLELIGATFSSSGSRSTPLVLATGVMVVDHKTTINVGDDGITLGDGNTEFDLQIRPGATITVEGTGTLLYQQEL